jgi:hypothetical protein
MAAPKKKPAKGKAVKMVWKGHLGKYVPKNMHRSKIALKAALKTRGKRKKFKNNAKRIANIKKSMTTRRNIYGKKTRPIGRPKGAKDTKPRKPRTMKGPKKRAKAKRRA